MPFPVEEVIPEIKRHLGENRDVVLTAPPGSGKTTCLPPALLDEPWLKGRKILMLEPRRLAARNCARYIAAKTGSPVGGTVGYRVRLESKVSAATRLEIITEGLLTRRILEDMELSDAGLVIFDEFHERSLACDMAFALALEVKRALRPDLRILVMSATLDADETAAHLDGAEIVRAEGRMFPVETRYLGDVSMTAAVSRALKETEGDILCFLPGEGEIRRAAAACAQFAGVEIMPLYGALDKDDQDRVFRPCPRRKLILATSIAETSLTIEGISCVIDSGLMRVPRFRPATGMSALMTLPLTMDRAEQRRGRAGRLAAGVCYRLWPETEDASRPRKMMPEILESDLAPVVLTSAAWGAYGREDLPWLTPPAEGAWKQAVELLKMLGALDDGGRLTERGRKMASLPIHPRLANMILGGGDPVLAAVLEEGVRGRESDIRRVPRGGRTGELARRFRIAGCRTDLSMSEGEMLALAYPDRIAKNRGNGTFRMVNGRGAFLEREDPLASEPYLVCCELDDRTGDAKIHSACPLDEAAIEEMFADRITETTLCEWDRRTDRVKSVVRRMLGEMALEENPVPLAAGDDALAARVAAAMLEGVRVRGVANLPCWTKESLQLRARIAFLHRHVEGWPDPDDETVRSALEGFVGGCSKWKDLEKIDLFRVFDFILSEHGHDRRELDRLAPVRMEVPSGSRMLIRYEGEEPTVEVRLQECFGLMSTPKVAGGKVPVVMTLLSPAQRPIQVTRDLKGFWQGAYQLVRKDMRGRYPKHYWPEDPFTALATSRVRPR
jgi:ATP-dependent helicase HrpB